MPFRTRRRQRQSKQRLSMRMHPALVLGPGLGLDDFTDEQLRAAWEEHSARIWSPHAGTGRGAVGVLGVRGPCPARRAVPPPARTLTTRSSSEKLTQPKGVHGDQRDDGGARRCGSDDGVARNRRAHGSVEPDFFRDGEGAASSHCVCVHVRCLGRRWAGGEREPRRGERDHFLPRMYETTGYFGGRQRKNGHLRAAEAWKGSPARKGSHRSCVNRGRG